VNGKLHREDGPAMIWTDGTKEWYREGKLYRTVLSGGETMHYNQDGSIRTD